MQGRVVITINISLMIARPLPVTRRPPPNVISVFLSFIPKNHEWTRWRETMIKRCRGSKVCGICWERSMVKPGICSVNTLREILEFPMRAEAFEEAPSFPEPEGFTRKLYDGGWG